MEEDESGEGADWCKGPRSEESPLETNTRCVYVVLGRAGPLGQSD